MFKRKRIILFNIFVVCCIFLWNIVNINNSNQISTVNSMINNTIKLDNMVDNLYLKVYVTGDNISVDSDGMFIINSSLPFINIKIPKLNQLSLFNNNYISNLDFNVTEFGQLDNDTIKHMNFYIDDVSDNYNYSYNLKLPGNKLLLGEYYIKYNFNFNLKYTNLLRVIRNINIPMFGIVSNFNIRNCNYDILYENIAIESLNLYKINDKKLDLDVRFNNPYKSSQFNNTYKGTLENYVYSIDKFIGVTFPISNVLGYNEIFLYMCIFCFIVVCICFKFIINNRKSMLDKRYNKFINASNDDIEKDDSFFINLGILKNKIFTVELIYIDIIKLAMDGFICIHIKNKNIFLELIKDYKEMDMNIRYSFILSTLFSDTRVLCGKNLKEKYYILYDYYTTFYNKQYYKDNFVYKYDIIIKCVLLVINYAIGLLFTYFMCGGSISIGLFTVNYIFIALLFMCKHKNNNYYLCLSVAMLILLVYNIYYLCIIIIYIESIILSLIYLVMYILFVYTTIYISIYDGIIYTDKYNIYIKKISSIISDITESNMSVKDTILYVISLKLYDTWVINYAETEDKLDWFKYEDDIDIYDKNGFKELLLYINSLDDIL